MSRSTDEPTGCLGALLSLFGGGGDDTADDAGPLPYGLRDDFLSPAELSFYRVLASALGERAAVCPKVGLGGLFFVAHPNENVSYLNRIRQKHVDFVVCQPQTIRPLVVIELDDASHARPRRQAHDAFIERAFQAAGLPLLRVPVRAAYAAEELRALLAPYLGEGPTGAAVPPTLLAVRDPAEGETATAEPPACPRCGVPMVVRRASRGSTRARRSGAARTSHAVGRLDSPRPRVADGRDRRWHRTALGR